MDASSILEAGISTSPKWSNVLMGTNTFLYGFDKNKFASSLFSPK